MIQGSNHDYATTKHRLSALRATVLTRDHYKCDISRVFDRGEAMKRGESDGVTNARDDEGNLLQNLDCDYLEAAHIIRDSLMREGENEPVSFLYISS